MSLKVKVRPLRRVDIDTEYCQWYENSDGHLDFFTGSGRKFTREILIDDYEKGKSSGRWYYYIIETLNRERVGNIKIGPIDLVNRTSDLVCLIGNRNFLGQGLGVEAIKLGNKIAFEELNIRRLHGGMIKDNVPSIKAYTRAGWTIEGTFRGYYWINGKSVDRICVSCLNPSYFKDDGK